MKHNIFYQLSYFDENDNLVIESFHSIQKERAFDRYEEILSNDKNKEIRFTKLRVYRYIIETIILDNGKPF